jgi:hypothetical protein
VSETELREALRAEWERIHGDADKWLSPPGYMPAGWKSGRDAAIRYFVGPRLNALLALASIPAEPEQADEVAGQAMTLAAELREAYTLLVSAEPTLIRNATTSTNATTAHFKALLRDRVTEWVDRYRDDFDGGLAARRVVFHDDTSGGAS